MRLLNRTLLCVCLAIVGAVGCASKGGFKPPEGAPATGQGAVTPPDVVRKRLTRIVVNPNCKATIDDQLIVGKIGKKVAWLVEDNGCAGDWHIELEFATGWNNGGDRIVKIKRDDIKSVNINRATKPTEGKPLYYKVVIVAGTTRVELIDPELEIEP
jgi:hypothetical protein